jgi:hypothetical protein
LQGLDRFRDKVAIVGFARTSRDQAPFDDDEWEIWSLNDAYTWIPKAHRWFELHSDWNFRWKMRRPPQHARWLADFPGPVYMLDVAPDIPNAIRFPIEAVTQAYGDYMTSSIAYMQALAMLMGYSEIGIWGVEMATATEYAEQRPCCEYLVGLARGMGIEVYLPPGCNLLSGPMYGRGGENPDGERHSHAQFESRLAALSERDRAISAEVDKLGTLRRQLEGAMEETRWWSQQVSSPKPFVSRMNELEERRNQLAAKHADLNSHMHQIRGAIMETRFWIGNTPEGLRREGEQHGDGDGDATDGGAGADVRPAGLPERGDLPASLDSDREAIPTERLPERAVDGELVGAAANGRATVERGGKRRQLRADRGGAGDPDPGV